MNKAQPEAKRIFRRIIITFLIAIILPSVLLGYFGIYAIQNERDVLKGGVKENHLAVAKFVYAQLKDEILEREGKVRRDVNLFLPSEYNRDDVSIVMDRLRLVHKLVKESFLLTDKGQLLYPLEFTSDDVRSDINTRVPSTIPQAEFQKHIELEQIYNEGRKLEFSANSPKLAIEQYSQVATSKINLQIAAEAGYAIGRCYSKTGDHKRAAESFSNLFSVSPSIWLKGGLPVPLEAHLEASKERVELGEEDKAIELLLEAYSVMLDYGYPLKLSEFKQVSEQIQGDLDTLDFAGKLSAGDRAEYSNLLELEKLRLSQNNYARVLKNNFLPQLLKAFEKPAQVPQTGRHITLDSSGEKITIMFFFPFTVGSVGGRGVKYLYGCVLNTEYIRELASALVGGGRFEEGLVVVVKSGEQVMTVSPGSPENFADTLAVQNHLLSAEQPFSEIVPHWSIGVYYINMGKLDQWISRRLMSHVATVLLLIVVILVGVFLSLRGISREIELSKMKSDFVSNVSHELKTPLTSIRMFAEMLKTGRVRNTDKQQEYFEIITAESERLSRLINNVLDFAKVQEGSKKYAFELLDFNEITKETTRIIQPHISKNGFNLEIFTSSDPLPIMGDRDSLGQVLLNILNNAVKYSAETKEIKIRTYASEKSALLEISDRGIGISEEEMHKIFNKFYRADSRPGYQSAGAGLGLTLAKQIVETHKGTIKVKSEVGKGSTFTITLPLADEPEAERSLEK